MSPILAGAIFLAGVLINSVAQIMLKKSALRTYPSRLREYLNALVICSYIMSTGVTFIFTAAYKVLPLSMGPILESAGYVFVTIWGALIFGEKVNARKLGALALIISGIAIYSIFG